MVTWPQSHIKKHISFLEMLKRGERLRIELMKKATQGELKAILELCLNMNEGNLSLHKRKSYRTVVSTLANRDIPVSNKKKWMLTQLTWGGADSTLPPLMFFSTILKRLQL